MEPTCYYKLLMNGIVYLVDPHTAIAYTYDVTSPLAIGTVEWLNPDEQPVLTLYPNWRELQAAKVDASQPPQPPQPPCHHL